MRPVLAVVVVVVVLIVVYFARFYGLHGRIDGRHGRTNETQGRKATFWTQYGGAIPADEQARRFDAAEKGVPDMAWAEAYWPPNYCRAVPPPVPGEPKRPSW